MILRSYRPSDCEEMARLFFNTVHSVNARDYSKEQRDAWATGKVDLQKWDRSFRENKTVIAEEEGQIIGFGDMDDKGYLDYLYVHKDFQSQGVATAICDYLEEIISATSYCTHASITAKPFFEQRGYVVEKEQQVERNGVKLTNYVMRKSR